MTNILTLAQQIKSGEYPREDVDVEQFFDEEGNPLRGTRIQVRDHDRDIDRIDRAVDKMVASGDTSKLEDLTLVKFPFDIKNLLNGSHTAEMILKLKQRGVKLPQTKGCVVDFQKDLGGKYSNALALGNKLNEIEVEKGDIGDNDIKNHLFTWIGERVTDGLDPKPPEDEIKQFMELYNNRISRATIGQWISNRDDIGGRRSPRYNYSKGEQQSVKRTFESMLKYRDYVVLDPRNLRGALETGVAQAFRQMKTQKKKKCLVILFCDSATQTEQWEDCMEEKIKVEYHELSVYWDVTIEYEMLRYA